jgi:hypothetical protein
MCIIVDTLDLSADRERSGMDAMNPVVALRAPRTFPMVTAAAASSIRDRK